ncbi:MAG: VOC family protein, partial [Rhodospirillales bacterium]|nr:VOC family protein [Rhodospirillales bacterium]
MGKRQEKSPPADAFIAIDHVLVGVADLEGARRAWEGLGFTVTPRGRHKGWGTANYSAMMAHHFIELLGIVDADKYATPGLEEFLQRREGLMAVAL